MRSNSRFVVFRDTAGEDEIELMLIFVCRGFAPVNFRDMHQMRHGDRRADLFQAFAYQTGVKCFAWVLLAAGQGEVAALDWVPLVLHQQPVAPADEGSWG